LFYVAAAVKNGYDLHRRSFRPVNDQVGVHREELHRFIGQILARVSGAGVRRQENDLFPNDRLNAVRNFEAALLFAVLCPVSPVLAALCLLLDLIPILELTSRCPSSFLFNHLRSAHFVSPFL
jgi:hypothetical protein